MMNFKEFDKDEMMPFVRKYGFSEVDDSAFVKVVLTVEVLVYNMLNNVLYITNALNLKILKKQHFEAVMSIIKDMGKLAKQDKTKQAGQKGGHGGTTLPSEYFGVESGRYFENVSQYEQSAFADGVTRAPINISADGAMQSGGRGSSTAKTFITKDQIKAIIGKFKTEKKLSFKVSRVAYDVIAASVMQNLSELLSECKKTRKGSKSSKSNVLTQSLIFSVMSKNASKFAHMNYVWKN